ncbi:hypothetical protein B9Z55_000291 [Caenorhabditis nigoni]|uniref:Uncharacterized protein n=1 Tax=Caenorhabditis nigoni TaxID=1611254 RepID=A0A2G5VMP4_9PELO|nr:hypothetical protein B9Z55_000291 [Caenorhabditis nigoni]
MQAAQPDLNGVARLLYVELPEKYNNAQRAIIRKAVHARIARLQWVTGHNMRMAYLYFKREDNNTHAALTRGIQEQISSIPTILRAHGIAFQFNHEDVQCEVHVLTP